MFKNLFFIILIIFNPLSLSIAKADKYKNSLVRIEVETADGKISRGVGTFVHPKGYILTAKHIVEKLLKSNLNTEPKITLYWHFANGAQGKFTIPTIDLYVPHPVPQTDLAILKINDTFTKFPYLCVSQEIDRAEITGNDDLMITSLRYIEEIIENGKRIALNHWSYDTDNKVKISTKDSHIKIGKWEIKSANLDFFASMSGSPIIFKDKIIGVISGHISDQSKKFIQPYSKVPFDLSECPFEHTFASTPTNIVPDIELLNLKFGRQYTLASTENLKFEFDVKQVKNTTCLDKDRNSNGSCNVGTVFTQIVNEPRLKITDGEYSYISPISEKQKVKYITKNGKNIFDINLLKTDSFSKEGKLSFSKITQ